MKKEWELGGEKKKVFLHSLDWTGIQGGISGVPLWHSFWYSIYFFSLAPFCSCLCNEHGKGK